MQKLVIPKAKKARGLYVHCNQCKSKSTSKLKANSSCSHPAQKMTFRAILTKPGTRSIASRILDTRDIDQAIKQLIDFETELKMSDYNIAKQNNDINNIKPQDLRSCCAMYIDYLQGYNVFEHQKRQRSVAHIKSVKRYLDNFVTSLINADVNVGDLLISQVADFHVDIYYKYLDKKRYSNRTFNRCLDTVSELYKYLIEFKNYNLKNYFSPKNVVRKNTNFNDVDSISKNEFNNLLSKINHKNGIEVLTTGERKYHYFDWLENAFKLALLTGVRRDGIIQMRFNNIIESDGVPHFIKIEDFKNNRKNAYKNGTSKKYIIIPIIKELNELLHALGYSEYKNTDRFVIAPESKRSRNTLKDDMSKSFTQYCKYLNTEKQLSFYSLRKTYITYLNLFTGNKAHCFTGHYDQDVIQKHYQDPKMTYKVLNDFRVFEL